MKRRVNNWIAPAFCAACLLAAADDTAPRKYTLPQCVEIGLKKSARIRTAIADYGIAESAVEQARSTALPGLSLSGSYTRLDELQTISIGDDETQLGTLNNYSVDATVNQLLYSGGKVAAALRAARLSRRLADESRAEAELTLIRDIKTGFRDVLLAGEAVSVREDSLKQLEHLRGLTAARTGAGADSEFDLLRATVRAANEKPEVIRARAGYEIAMAGFKRLIGLDDENIVLDGELEYEPVDIRLDELLKEALTSRHAILQAGVALDLRNEDVVAAKARYLPDISAYFNYNGANSYGFVSYDNDWQWHWSAGLQLQWSIFDGGLTRGIVREKEMALEKSRIALDDLEKIVALEIKQAYLDMKHAAESVEAGRGNIDLAKKALDIAAARLESGAGTYLEFTDANVALSAARLGWMTAVRDHMNAITRLEAAAGRRPR